MYWKVRHSMKNILLIVAVVCFILALYHLTLKIVMIKAWPRTTAKIIKVTQKGNRRHPAQLYALEYEVDGEKHVGDTLIGSAFSNQVFDSYLNAEYVEIAYDPNHRKISILTVKEDWVFILVLLFWSVFCLILALNIS